MKASITTYSFFRESMLHSSSILWFLLITGKNGLLAFNLELEPEAVTHFLDPTLSEFSWGRDSYFGFSVSLQENSSWFTVGAPRANSSFEEYKPDTITEPGVIFKCYLQDTTCVELYIDQTGNSRGENEDEIIYKDQKSNGWLGATLDSQQTNTELPTANFATCAPRWCNQDYGETYYMIGACYLMNSSMSRNQPAKKIIPLIEPEKYANVEGENTIYHYGYGQAGISLHFPSAQTEMVLGAPGVYNWRGSVIRIKDVGSNKKFSSQTFNPYLTKKIDPWGLNGYSVSSGHFISMDDMIYASGAPRAAASKGKVLLFDFPATEDERLIIHGEIFGTSQGEGFGASLVSADLNGDGLTDLIVGCPTFSTRHKIDIGRIQVFFGNKDNIRDPISIRMGSESSNARFGTTLSFLGDINHDSYEDIAVGAPWEDEGTGAVYIYLGTSEYGLRERFSQRISPEDFPNLIPLRGFGMGLSRGVDIDDSGYPDIGIGSFLAGGVIILKSRSVASLRGELYSKPSALAVNSTHFQLDSCITYDGYRVPSKAKGTITIYLDEVFKRATFDDDGSRIKTINAPFIRGDRTCLEYRVNVENSKLHLRRPVIVKLELSLEDAPTSRLSIAKTDPSESRTLSLPIGLVTGCEGDNNPTCITNTSVIASFLNYNRNQPYPIGDENLPKLEIKVSNSGEPLFNANVTIEVPQPFALFIPDSHSCNFPIYRQRSLLICDLVSPINEGMEDILILTVDAGSVTDAIKRPQVNVAINVVGEGIEVIPSNNNVSALLPLTVKAHVELRGYSVDEEVFYKRIGEHKINSSVTSLSFSHDYNVVKSGPTPITRVELEVDIPVNFTNNDNKNVQLIYPYDLETNFMGQPYSCDFHGDTLFTRRVNNTFFHLHDKQTAIRKKTLKSSKNVVAYDDSTVHRKVEFKCSDKQVTCLKLKCLIHSLPAGKQFAKFSIKMAVHLINLASQISAKEGAIVHSTAKVTILSPNENLPFVGVKNNTGTIHTDILPDSMSGKGIPWWIILLAVLGSLLLLALIVFIMYKKGFFVREEKEKMAEHRARVVHEATEDSANVN